MEATLTPTRATSSALRSGQTWPQIESASMRKRQKARKAVAAVRRGLAGDLRRNQKAICAFALYAERAAARKNMDQEIALASRGQQQVIHGLILAKVFARFGGSPRRFFNEATFVDGSAPCSPEWACKLAARLRWRAEQCIAAGDPDAALQLRRLADVEEQSPDLFLLVEEPLRNDSQSRHFFSGI